MSVIILEKTIFLAVARKMFEAKSSKRVNENHYSCCLGLSDKKIIELTTSWHDLNYDTYKNKYSNIHDIPPFIELIISVTPPPPNAVQFLKWLQCIRQNIDAQQFIQNNRKAVEDILFLDRLICQVCVAIVDQLPDYKNANWSIYK